MIEDNSNLKIVDASSREQELKDMEILQKILEGRINLVELDEFTKRRIIKTCNKRLCEMKNKVENIKNKTKRLQEILHKVEKI